jgi:hypothetical protein
VANVATLVSRLRRALGSEVIHGDRQGYRPGDLAVVVDLDEAARLTDRAERELEPTLTPDELNARLDATLTATTHGELSQAARDLPA